jgi:hypothetical protein
VFIVPLLLAATLQHCDSYSGPNDGAIHVCGHAYNLICTRSGFRSDCLEHRDSPAEVDHFELRDENNRVLFERSTSAGEFFEDVGISSSGYPDHPQLFTISVEKQADANSCVPPKNRYDYYFHATPAGLTEFHPALGCGDGTAVMLGSLNAWPQSGLGLGCTFNAGYVRFTANLEFDFDDHRIMLAPEPSRLYLAGDADKLSAKAVRASTLRIYRDHDEHSQHSTTHIIEGQLSRVTAAWVPIALRTCGAISMLTYDSDKLWLEITLGDRRFWIAGSKSFQSIGLRSASIH